MSRDPSRITRHLRFHRKKRGLAPGTLVFGGTEVSGPVRIRVHDYNDEHLDAREIERVDDLAPYRDKSDTVTWINIDGVHDVKLVERIGQLFGIHPLTLEDIVGTNQRPKMEEYPEYVYIVLQMMHYDHEQATLRSEQVSLVFGEGFLISFQESEGDVFQPIRKRLEDHRGRIRSSGADYLAYALIDIVVDFYMDILEGLGEHIEELEDAITATPHPEMMQRINGLRRRVVHLRRSIWPVRDVITGLERSDLPFISPETEIFLRDVYDHTVRTAEIVESAREILASLTDMHISTLSFRMNEIMKILAIIATFFLPLTFIAGVYGMNFQTEASPLNMPELSWYYGYPFVLALMIGIAAGMYLFFRRRGWL